MNIPHPIKLGLAGLVCSLVVWLGLTPVTQAATVDDTYITSASIDSVSSTTFGASATYTLSMVTSAPIESGSYLYIYLQSMSGCNATDWATCSPDLMSATLSGISGELVSTGSATYLAYALSETLAAGTHTLTLNSVTNPTSANTIRALFSTSASDEEALLGDTFSSNNWYATASTAQMFGTPLVYGTVSAPTGEALESASVNLRDSTYSAYAYTSTDSEGFYSIFQDYFDAGYWPAGTLTVSATPSSESDYLTTETEISFDGSTGVTANIAVDASAYFFAGSVVYGSNKTTTTSSNPGDPVTNAYLYFFPLAGGTGYSATTDSNGAYSVAVRPGTYSVSLSLDSADENQDQDWLYEDTSNIFTVSDVGTVESDITVTRTTAKLKGSVLTANNDVVQGTITLSNTDHNYTTYVASDGTYTLNLNPGTFTVTFFPDTYINPDASKYFFDTTTITVAEGKTDFGMTLKEKTSSVVVTVTDESGNPLSGVQVSASRESEWSSQTTDANGQATLWVQSNLKYLVYPWLDGYIYNESSTEVKVAANASSSLSFTLESPDASISVLVTDTDGAVTSGYGYVSCGTEGESEWFGGSITNGAGTVYLTIEDGQTFEGMCNLWMNDESLGAATSQAVSVELDEVEELEFSLIERSAEVVIYVKNLDGTLVKDAFGGQVNVWNEESSMWQSKELDPSGKTKLKVVPGTYTGGVWFLDNSYIPLWNKNNGSVTVKEEESGKLALTVVKASAQISGTVVDPNGDPVENGWVYCGNWEEVSVQGDFEGGTVIDTGAQVTDGSFTMSVVGGHDYRCNVGAPPEYVEQGWLSPEDQTVTVSKDESSVPTLSFQFGKADSKIIGSLTWPTQASVTAKSSKQAWCWAWGEEGGHSYAQAKKDGTFSLSVQSGGVWHYGCDSQDGEDWLTTGEQTVNVDTAQTIEKNLELKKFSAWKVYSPVTQTFDATENVVINLEDGTVLTIPAYAIAASGEVTITATPESEIVYTGDSMLGVPWNFEAFVDGELVETFAAEVTIEIPYTNMALQEFGVDEDSLVSKYYDEASGTWKMTDNVTQNKKINTITISTNHFTQYGVTYNTKLGSGLKPASPQGLTSAGKTTTSATLSWQKGSKKKVTSYVVQVRPENDSNKKHWSAYSSVKDKLKVVKKLKKGTDYQFRVKACNSGFCSDYSNWKGFKTK